MPSLIKTIENKITVIQHDAALIPLSTALKPTLAKIICTKMIHIVVNMLIDCNAF